MPRPRPHVCFTPESGHQTQRLACYRRRTLPTAMRSCCCSNSCNTGQNSDRLGSERSPAPELPRQSLCSAPMADSRYETTRDGFFNAHFSISRPPSGQQSLWGLLFATRPPSFGHRDAKQKKARRSLKACLPVEASLETFPAAESGRSNGINAATLVEIEMLAVVVDVRCEAVSAV
jgi:hypothetical protein